MQLNRNDTVVQARTYSNILLLYSRRTALRVDAALLLVDKLQLRKRRARWRDDSRVVGLAGLVYGPIRPCRRPIRVGLLLGVQMRLNARRGCSNACLRRAPDAGKSRLLLNVHENVDLESSVPVQSNILDALDSVIASSANGAVRYLL